MPVEDHPIHDKVRHPNFHYAACKVAVRQPGYYVLTRKYFPDGRYELINEYIFDTMSKACRNLAHDSDPACAGCTQPKDLEYINKMKELV